MFEPGDILLFTLSAWKETSWGAFKKAFDEIYRIRLTTEEISDPNPVRFERAHALRILVSLGHCDADFSNSRSITIGLPTLALLPYLGLPRAVLCGSRSPMTLATLQTICNDSRKSLRLILGSQRRRAPYAPSRVEIEAESHSALAAAARALNIGFNKTSPAWIFTVISGSLSEYIGQLEWSSQPEVNWDREDFGARHFAFMPVQVGTTSTMRDLRLSRYLNPVRGQWEYRLVKDNRSAGVGAEWGRYAILNANGQNSLLYDARSGSLAVARGTPLPVSVARGLVLCSGYAPTTLKAQAVQSRIPEHYGFDVYAAVPPDVAKVVIDKLGQRDPLDPFFIQEKTR